MELSSKNVINPRVKGFNLPDQSNTHWPSFWPSSLFWSWISHPVQRSSNRPCRWSPRAPWLPSPPSAVASAAAASSSVEERRVHQLRVGKEKLWRGGDGRRQRPGFSSPKVSLTDDETQQRFVVRESSASGGESHACLLPCPTSMPASGLTYGEAWGRGVGVMEGSGGAAWRWGLQWWGMGGPAAAPCCDGHRRWPWSRSRWPSRQRSWRRR
jgi:hypothetical protein